MNITATSENKPQVIGEYYAYTNGQVWYSGIRLVAWISQNVNTGKTKLYTKWQRNQFNYWTYDLNSHSYSVKIGNVTRTDKFALPFVQSNGIYDLTKPQSIELDQTSGSYSGTMSVEGYKTWETFTDSISITFPDITVVEPDPEEPSPDVQPPAPLVFNNDPIYTIYADDDLVYKAGIDGYEVLNPKLTLEVNKAGSLKFDIPVGSAMYGKLSKLSTTVDVRQGDEPIFRGRVLNTTRSFNNTISYYCEGFLSWLNDIVFLPYVFPEDDSKSGQARDLLKRYLERYNSRALTNRQIEYIYSDVSAKIAVNVEDHSNAWAEIKKVLIDGVGGYIVPYLTDEITGIQWLSTYGTTTDQIIQFGENLLDFSEFIDASEVFTAVRPLGAKDENGNRITMSGGTFVNDANAIIRFGRIERTAIFDEITDRNALRTAGREYLRTGLQAAVSLNLKAADLHLLDANVEKFRTGNAVRVISVPHEIDAYFLNTKQVLDLSNPSKSTYTFGATQRTISELTNAGYNKFVITEGA